jgi:hypothetical protein
MKEKKDMTQNKKKYAALLKKLNGKVMKLPLINTIYHFK